MQSGDIHVLVFDGFADWEPAYALAELRRTGERDVVVLGFDGSPVMSMGGLRIPAGPAAGGRRGGSDRPAPVAGR